jgi:branched-chain amino acid transport system permease protein
MTYGRAVSPDRVVAVLALGLAVTAPLYVSTYWLGALLTHMLFLGIAAASLIFLSAYGGMVSLAQISIYGIAGFVVGNVTTNGNTKGLNLGWSPYWGVVVGIAFAVVMALLFGALANRSVGIYFLMITLTYGVIANLFFGQVTQLSGFGGISGITPPSLLGSADAHPDRLYYVALVLSVLVYALLRYLVRTPFGLTLQGLRDDPVRMSSLGYHVGLHRTLAFAFAGFIASIGGILFVWWNGHIDPASIDIGRMVSVLAIAVIGGLYRLEGAWIGSFIYVVLNNYLQTISWIGPRFDTVIGIIFLVIVLVSPAGVMGIWERLVGLLRSRDPGGGGTPPHTTPASADL